MALLHVELILYPALDLGQESVGLKEIQLFFLRSSNYINDISLFALCP